MPLSFHVKFTWPDFGEGIYTDIPPPPRRYAPVVSTALQFLTASASHTNSQYTPPTRLSCRVESRRRCVLGLTHSIQSRHITYTILEMVNVVSACRTSADVSNASLLLGVVTNLLLLIIQNIHEFYC